jgi:cytochrome c peroxidase
MRLINIRFSDENQMFWDERANNVEEQTTMPIRDHLEMGFSGLETQPTFQDLLTKLRSFDEYQILFTTAFGDPSITERRIQLALAQFIRSIQSFDSLYDKGRAMVTSDLEDFPNFTEAQNRGKQFFNEFRVNGGAGCANCHHPPVFGIEPGSGGNGIVGSRDGSQDFDVTRAPTLRDLVNAEGRPHSAFMHDSSLPTLMDVVNHYANIDQLTPNLDSRLRFENEVLFNPGDGSSRFSEQGKADLVSFLRTLTGVNVYTDPKFSDPFSSDGDLDLKLMVDDSLVFRVIQSNSSQRSGLELLLRGAPNLLYSVEASSDLNEWFPIAFIEGRQEPVQLVIPLIEGREKMFHRLVFKLEHQPLFRL